MENDYIIANIKIPLQVNSDGTYSTMTDYIDIQFSNHDGCVLEKSEDSDASQFNEILMNIMKKNAHNIRKKSYNMSFKNHPRKAKRFTMKANNV